MTHFIWKNLKPHPSKTRDELVKSMTHDASWRFFALKFCIKLCYDILIKYFYRLYVMICHVSKSALFYEKLLSRRVMMSHDVSGFLKLGIFLGAIFLPIIPIRLHNMVI